MIPQSLLEAYRKLWMDESGKPKLIRLDGLYGMGAAHVIHSRGGESSLPAPVVDRSNCGDAIYFRFDRDIGSDPVVSVLPPPGTQVWQVCQDGMTLRTTRISHYPVYGSNGVKAESAFMTAAGPAAGIPWDGDSGSVCWVREGGEWRVLGVVSMRRMCFVSRPSVVPESWTTLGRLTIPAGFPIGVVDLTAPVFAAAWEGEGEGKGQSPVTKDQGPNPKDEIPMTKDQGPDPAAAAAPAEVHASVVKADLAESDRALFLDQVPTSRRIMGMHSVGDDGTDSVAVDVKLPSWWSRVIIISVVIEGRGGDRWEWRDTFDYWHVRAISFGEKLRFFFKPNNAAVSYRVTLKLKKDGKDEVVKYVREEPPLENVLDGFFFPTVGGGFKEGDPGGKPSDTAPIPPPQAPAPPADQAAPVVGNPLAAEVASLREQVATLMAGLEQERARVVALQEENAQAAEKMALLKARLEKWERYREALREVMG